MMVEYRRAGPCQSGVRCHEYSGSWESYVYPFTGCSRQASRPWTSPGAGLDGKGMGEQGLRV